MFIGPSGKVLDELLQISDVDRKELYMTNLVKCMLPKHRKPKQDEIDICSGYLDREIELTDPKILVPLGHYSTTYIFKKYNLFFRLSKIFMPSTGNFFYQSSEKYYHYNTQPQSFTKPNLKKFDKKLSQAENTL